VCVCVCACFIEMSRLCAAFDLRRQSDFRKRAAKFRRVQFLSFVNDMKSTDYKSGSVLYFWRIRRWRTFLRKTSFNLNVKVPNILYLSIDFMHLVFSVKHPSII